MSNTDTHTGWCRAFNEFLEHCLALVPDNDDVMNRLMDVGNPLYPSYRETDPIGWKRDLDQELSGLADLRNRTKDSKANLKRVKCPSEFRAVLKLSEKIADSKSKIVEKLSDQIKNSLKGLHEDDWAAVRRSQKDQQEVYKAGRVLHETVSQLMLRLNELRLDYPQLADSFERRVSELDSAA